MVTKLITLALVFLVATEAMYAQPNLKDSTNAKWTTHFQATVISQKHAGFRSLYDGKNSLADTVEPTATSLTSTLFLGRSLWKNAAFYFNPEISGGNGLSFAIGSAGALNGETYRIGEVKPQLFIARAYLQQHIPLANTTYEKVSEGINQVAAEIPTSRITISAGKFAIADFYDDNRYSKDPRKQFFNWSLWANGAWDYPANTRGYTFGLIGEIVKPTWAIRVSSVAVPRIANFHLMEYNSHAHSETLEFEHNITVGKQPGTIRFIISNTYSQAPSYKEGLNAIANNDTFLLNVIQGIEERKSYGGRKFGLGINIKQQLTNNFGFFSRLGWNDGKHATWAFTEIDNTVNAGISLKGMKWKRPDDFFAIAVVSNGISKDHRAFLKIGGYGFIIGDGNLNYDRETIIETYYSTKLTPFFWLTFDYQFVNNPAYNKDRGPVHVFGIRGHIEF